MRHTLSPGHSIVLALTLALAGCPGDEPATSNEPAADATPTPDPAPAQIDVAEVRSEARTVLFVPNPSEIANALNALELSTDVSALVTPRSLDFGPMDGPQIALNTGAVTADLVLTIGQSENASIAAQVRTISSGLAELGAPQDMLDTAEQFAARVEAGSLSSDAILAEVDQFQSSFLDGIERYSSHDAAVGLQAGAWIRAVQVVGGAIKNGNKTEQGAHLFRQPAVVAYFLDYVRDNAEKAGDGSMLEAVVPAMEQLHTTASKESLAAEDVDAIIAAADTILAQF